LNENNIFISSCNIYSNPFFKKNIYLKIRYGIKVAVYPQKEEKALRVENPIQELSGRIYSS